MAFVPFEGFGPYESYEADETGQRRRDCWSWPVSSSTSIFTPGHSPGHVTYSVRGEDAIFSGDVLFQGSVGRVDLPGGDWADAAGVDPGPCSTPTPTQTVVYPGHMGTTTLGAERATNPFLAELAR